MWRRLLTLRHSLLLLLMFLLHLLRLLLMALFHLLSSRVIGLLLRHSLMFLVLFLITEVTSRQETAACPQGGWVNGQVIRVNGGFA